jgi:DNA-binding transcriptional regulator LsrR (DeoR family)
VLSTGYITPQEQEALGRAGAAGDICSRFYDLVGRRIQLDLADRTISIDLDILKGLDYSIAVAGGAHKVPAILGALRGRFINVLITTEETARLLLEAANETVETAE